MSDEKNILHVFTQIHFFVNFGLILFIYFFFVKHPTIRQTVAGATDKYGPFDISVKYQPKLLQWAGRVAQSVGHLTRKSGVLGSIPGLATYFRFSFRVFKKGSCQLLAKVCARSTG